MSPLSTYFLVVNVDSSSVDAVCVVELTDVNLPSLGLSKPIGVFSIVVLITGILIPEAVILPRSTLLIVITTALPAENSKLDCDSNVGTPTPSALKDFATRSPPIQTSFATPIPPSTINDPVDGDVLFAVLLKFTAPVTFKVELISRLS